MSREKKIIISFGFLFLLYLFIVSEIDFYGPDEPLYLAHTASIMEDGDLNIANQLNPVDTPFFFPSGKPSVSKTYNLPDYHNHGGIVLWIPFYAYAKFMYLIASKLKLMWLTSYGLDRLIKCAMSFSTIVFGIFSLIFTFLFCRIFFSNKITLLSILIIFFGTPYYYFVLSEVGNAQIIASLFSILSIWFLSYAMSMRKSHWLLYGLFFSMCISVKIDLWFQIFFILFFFFVLFLMKRTSLRNGLYFFIGILPAFFLKFINDYIKYGTFHIGEFGLLNFNSFYLFEQLFSPYHGFFYTSPIFYICFLGFVFLTINLLKNKTATNDKKMQDLFLLIASIYLFIKIFILSFRYAWGGGTPGARILLTEFPIFVLLYARALQEQKRFLLKFFFFMITVVCILWNLIVISEFVAKVDLKYILSPPGLIERLAMLRYIVNPLFYLKGLELKIPYCLPLLTAAFGIIFYIIKSSGSIYSSFWYLINQNRHKSIKIFTFFTIYLYVTYTAVTVLNIFNNKKNVEKLKAEGFFENAEVIEPRYFEKLENISSLDEMIEYYTLKNDKNRVSKTERLKKELYNE